MIMAKLYWERSSAGEHMTEAHGVRGPTPRVPTGSIKTFIKLKEFY